MIVFVTCALYVSVVAWRDPDYYVEPDEKRDMYGPVNLTHTFFGRLQNYHVGANAIPESTYKWVAQVLHSKNNAHPLYCTGGCVSINIFITSAGCTYMLQVEFTRVIYQGERYKAKAFVVPSKETKQQFDDISFIIVHPGFNGTLEVVKMYWTPRPDDSFRWLETYDLSGPYKAIGYATEKGFHNKQLDTNYKLRDLPVYVDIKLCHEILTQNHKIPGFYVPCYHSCTLKDFYNEAEDCEKYHGVEGGGLLNMKTGFLFGVATWAAFSPSYELPVGFAQLGAPTLFVDFKCAKVIESDREPLSPGYLQRLCDDFQRTSTKTYRKLHISDEMTYNIY